jgi:hypothetical protein
MVTKRTNELAIARALLAAGCSGDDGRVTDPVTGPGIASNGGGSEGGQTGDGEDSLDAFPDVGNPGNSGTEGDDEECASQTTPAENKKQPADIIVVVDNSGSMDFEAGAVQDNLDAFSQQIVDSGIDVRVVLISSYPGDGNGICIDPPLDFDDQLKSLSPDYDDYFLNGIVCTTECEEAAQIGQVYIALGQLTGGIIADLCLQDFQPVFDQLATEVIEGAQIACEWDVPAAPPGEEFDPTKVNVTFDDGMGGGFDIGHVDAEVDCANVVDGWYYDDPVAPTKIVACAQTCQKIQGVEAATIEITLGCETVPAPAG